MAKGYWLAQVEVTDPDGYKDYVAANQAAFRKYGARYVIRAGRYEAVEGACRSRLVVSFARISARRHIAAGSRNRRHCGCRGLRRPAALEPFPLGSPLPVTRGFYLRPCCHRPA